MPDVVRILNVDILNTKMAWMLRNLTSGVVFTPNVDHLVRLQSDQKFYEIYQKADYVLCDSRILFFMSKLLRKSIRETISGSTFFHEYYKYYQNDTSKRFFILGGKCGIAQRAMERINTKLNNSIIVGAHSPSFHIDDKESVEIADLVNRSGANIVMVGLGSPLQEKWIINYKHLMPNVNIWLALGATVDFEAGTQRRAPKIFQRIGLEWFYRFIQEPHRLFRRYFIEDMKFFYYFLKQLLGLYNNPFESNQQ